MIEWVKRIRIRFLIRSLKPAKFRRWILLEEAKEKIIQAVRSKSNEFPDKVFSYLGIALNVNPKRFEGWYWEEVISLFYKLFGMNLPPSSLPLISIPSTEKKEKDTWDYQGRTWHLYSHLLAQSYGWSLEYIENLDVHEALAKVQEILTDEQLDREFLWNMSEKSVSYNPKTKTSKYNELPRPYWMKKVAKPAQRTQLPVSSMPLGNIDYAAVPPELKPQEINPS